MANRVLVAGGAGFIGSHLCERLLIEEHQVFCLDDFCTGSQANIAQFMGNPHFKLIRHDVINPINLEVDQIINLACPASPVHYQRNPIKTLKTSLLGCINLLELAKQQQALLLQASTSEVYGDPQIHPQTEEYWGHVNPLGDRSCYDEGKRAAESLCYEYRRQFNMNVKIVRIFNTYGPKMAQNDGRVVSNFIMQALNNQDITIYGQGRQSRSFCYITDLIDGIIKMVQADGVYGPVNLGNAAEYTILELAQKVLAITTSNSKLVFKPLPQDDPQQRRPDLSLAKACLNWEPIVKLEQGLKQTVQYFQQTL